jgi:hypothetical protein
MELCIIGTGLKRHSREYADFNEPCPNGRAKSIRLRPQIVSFDTRPPYERELALRLEKDLHRLG